jgi:hypothetical protein
LYDRQGIGGKRGDWDDFATSRSTVNCRMLVVDCAGLFLLCMISTYIAPKHMHFASLFIAWLRSTELLSSPFDDNLIIDRRILSGDCIAQESSLHERSSCAADTTYRI